MWMVSMQERLIGHFEVETWAFMVGFLPNCIVGLFWRRYPLLFGS